MNIDEKFIKIVYDLARESAKNGNDPFSAILVHKNEICHTSFDISVKSSNPTLHAELNVISEYCSSNKIFSLDGYSLYCNVEPCIMCSGAIHWSRISKVVYGISQMNLQKIKFFARHTLSARQAARYYGRACTASSRPAAKNWKTSCYMQISNMLLFTATASRGVLNRIGCA